MRYESMLQDAHDGAQARAWLGMACLLCPPVLSAPWMSLASALYATVMFAHNIRAETDIFNCVSKHVGDACALHSHIRLGQIGCVFV